MHTFRFTAKELITLKRALYAGFTAGIVIRDQTADQLYEQILAPDEDTYTLAAYKPQSWSGVQYAEDYRADSRIKRGLSRAELIEEVATLLAAELDFKEEGWELHTWVDGPCEGDDMDAALLAELVTAAQPRAELIVKEREAAKAATRVAEQEAKLLEQRRDDERTLAQLAAKLGVRVGGGAS